MEPLVSALVFAGFHNQSPGELHFGYAFYSLRSPAERMGNPKSAPHPHPPNPHAKQKKTQTHDFLSTLKPPAAVCKGKLRLR